MDFDKLKDYLIKKYNCHTLILYGSFAKGDFDNTSDVDVVGFTADDIETQDKSLFEGRTLDCWVYNERKMTHPEDFLHIRSGQTLLDQRHKASAFLADVHAYFDKGPAPQTYEAKLNIILWLEKMLFRASKEDLEGHYRYHWLLTDLLPLYFELNDQWYLGSKESFKWLEEHDTEAFDYFKALFEAPSLQRIEAVIGLAKRRVSYFEK